VSGTSRDRSVRCKYEFIQANKHRYNTRLMCRLLEVSPSGYYAWLKKPNSDRAIEDRRLLRLIRASFAASQCVYGAPRVFLDLREAGETCSKHRVARLMGKNNIRAQPGYRTRRYVAGKPAELIPNLVKRKFEVSRQNRVWVSALRSLKLQWRDVESSVHKTLVTPPLRQDPLSPERRSLLHGPN